MFASVWLAYVLWAFLGIFGAHVRTLSSPTSPRALPLTRRPSKRPFSGRPASHTLISLRQRFYVGRPASGIVWLLTGGLFGIGWLIDFFLIPDFV